MATFRIPILNWTARPDTSGNCFLTNYTNYATNGTWKQTIFVFANTGSSRINLYGSFQVPKNYTGSPVFVIKWTTQTTSGNVVWDLDYRAVGINESIDQATAQESLSVTDAAPGSTDLLQEVTVSATGTNLAADDMVEFLISRDLSDAADTLSDNVQLLSLELQYSDE